MHFLSFYLLILLLLVNASFVLSKDFSTKYAAYNDQEYNYNKQLLEQIPSNKATVGVVLVFSKNNELYALLARERIDGDNAEKRGKYSDLGGGVKLDGTSYLDNMLRELSEESMNLVNPNKQNFLKKCSLIYKKNGDRTIAYCLYLMNDEEYISSGKLNKERVNNKNLSFEAKEKDLFIWVNLKSLLKNKNSPSVRVRDIEGKWHSLTLRKYFMDDFLSNPMLDKAIENLTK
jgi:hypothetical protein